MKRWLLLLCISTVAMPCWAATEHSDLYAATFEAFAIILVCALVGRYVARKLKQSVVLGELVIGIVLGAVLYQFYSAPVVVIRYQNTVNEILAKVERDNATLRQAADEVFNESQLPEKDREILRGVLTAGHATAYINLSRGIMIFSTLGVALLLFQVGLESSVAQMKSIGQGAIVLAVLGIVLPFVLGWAVLKLLSPGAPIEQGVFMGAALSATSIGITARVFKDLGRLQTPEAQIVMGAAVFDDILGLIILAVVSGMVTTGSVDMASVGIIFGKAILFLAVILAFGVYALPRLIPRAQRLDPDNTRLLIPFILLLLCAWFADMLGLAMIVGAFAAGLITQEEYFSSHGKGSLHELLSPLEGIFAPIFFVIMGLQVDIGVLGDMNVLLAGVAMSVAAVVGKVVAAIFFRKPLDKVTIGIGMVPRGEVGLIFASIGQTLGVLDGKLYAVLVIVVLITTLVTPPALKWSIDRR